MQTKSMYDIPCDHKTKEAFVTEQNKDALMKLFVNAVKKRDQVAEEMSAELHGLMQLHINQEFLSEDQKNQYNTWQNLNDAIAEMYAFFCEEYKRKVLKFTSTAKRSIYKFLIAMEQFESIYEEK